MKRNLPNEEWIKRGCQRRAVVAVLKRPMTASQILREAKGIAPRIQLRDLWLILTEMRRRDLVACLNPEIGNGKVFSPTPLLRKGLKNREARILRDPDTYAWFYRGALRVAMCRTILGAQCRFPKGMTPSEIRKVGYQIRNTSKNAVLRGLGELRRKKLIVGELDGRRSSIRRYRLTDKGGRLLREGRSFAGSVEMDESGRSNSE